MGTPPVALIIFRRPDLTRQVFEAIRAARPPQLFVIADGPRNEAEQVLCQQTRAIVAQVDWPCEVVTNYAATNMGLRRRLISGISWVFEQTEEAIFLEDDCLPHPTFFRFCAELLERYRDEPRVMHISGNFYVNRQSGSESYYFTRYPHVWGWASWRRAWKHYDPDLATWGDDLTRRRFLQNTTSRSERRFWNRTLENVLQGKINTWDFQWTFSVMSQNGLCINPTRNLVTNLGFTDEATHTISTDSPFAKLEISEMTFPLVAPANNDIDTEADRQVAKLNFEAPPQWKALARRIIVLLVGRRAIQRIRRLRIH